MEGYYPKFSVNFIRYIGIDTPDPAIAGNHGVIDKISKDKFKGRCLPYKIEGLDSLQTRVLVNF